MKSEHVRLPLSLAFRDRGWKPQTSVSPITGRFADNYLASAHT